MNIDFFRRVNSALLSINGNQKLGGQISAYSANDFPDLDGVKLAMFGVLEDRLDEKRKEEPFHFDGIRKNLYNLYPGSWDLKIADLGDIVKGETVQDTYFAVETVVKELVKENIIPVILGGTQDLIYAQYRAYDDLYSMVNLVNVDSKFDLGDAEKPISNRSYVGKLIIDKPYNLFNYSNIGYQTYFNPQHEIELIEKLFFDAYRLGEVVKDINVVEPVMRDANIVGMDFGVVSANALGSNKIPSPNGFDGKEFCALARYAGLSDKVSSFGIYEYNSEVDCPTANMLIAQALWYFFEGVNFRKNENTIFAKKDFTKYQVPIDDEVLVFFKSLVSGRWWIEIPFISGNNNKLKRHTLLPCTEADYIDACNQVLPERWYKTRRKNEI